MLIVGLMLEKLESMAKAGTSVLIDGHPFEVIMARDNIIRKVRVRRKKIHSSALSGQGPAVRH